MFLVLGLGENPVVTRVDSGDGCKGELGSSVALIGDKYFQPFKLIESVSSLMLFEREKK